MTSTCLVAIAVLLTSSVRTAIAAERPAAADDKQEAKARFVAGQRHYNLNEFPEALREFKEGYRLYPDPVFLFNLGQCERQLGHFDEAIRFYRSFLREQPKAPNKQDVLHKIEEMEAAQRLKGAEPDKVVPPATAAETAPAVAEPPPAAPAVAVPAAPTALPAAPAGPAPTEPATAAPAPALPAAPAPIAGEPAARIYLSSPPAPAATPAPVYKRWWFWTAVAAVAVGAGVGIYAATANGSPTPPASPLGTKGVF